MAKVYLNRVVWFVVLVLLQALVLDNILLWGVARPILYIYLIMKLNTGTGRCEGMLWAFALGLAMDIFDNTPGAGAAALVLAAFVRPMLLRLFVPRDIQNDAPMVPSVGTFGIVPFFKYALAFVLVDHAAMLALEHFTFADFDIYLLRVAGCTVMTMAFVFVLELFTGKR